MIPPACRGTAFSARGWPKGRQRPGKIEGDCWTSRAPCRYCWKEAGSEQGASVPLGFAGQERLSVPADGSVLGAPALSPERSAGFA